MTKRDLPVEINGKGRESFSKEERIEVAKSHFLLAVISPVITTDSLADAWDSYAIYQWEKSEKEPIYMFNMIGALRGREFINPADHWLGTWNFRSEVMKTSLPFIGLQRDSILSELDSRVIDSAMVFCKMMLTAVEHPTTIDSILCPDCPVAVAA
jgi:hypothetical protein